MQVLALDFDGVISDSAPEAFVIALRTYVGMVPDSPFADRGVLLSGPSAPPLAAATGDPLYGPFLELMPLGNRAEDYAVELTALERGADLPDQPAYDAFRDSLSPEWLRDFHRRFYQVRSALSDADPVGWNALLGAYPAFVRLLRRRAGDAQLAIVTAKDRRSVGRLLRSYGIADLFPDDRILDKETGVSKAAHLEHLHATLGAAFGEITFVDDKANHLDSVAPLGVRCALAAWGYNGPREVALARERGYLVCALDDAEAQLFGEAG